MMQQLQVECPDGADVADTKLPSLLFKLTDTNGRDFKQTLG